MKILSFKSFYYNSKKIKQTLSEKFNIFVENVFRQKSIFDINCIIRKFTKTNINDISDSELKEHYSNHLFLVTLLPISNRFKRRSASNIFDATPIFSIYRKWYLDLCNKFMGAKFNKESKLQPFSIAFLDVEGTRSGYATSTFELPHIHALLLVHPKNLDKFLSTNQFHNDVCKQIFDGHKVEIHKCTDNGSSYSHLMTYASKYVRKILPDQNHEISFQTYPDLDKSKYPFYDRSANCDMKHNI